MPGAYYNDNDGFVCNWLRELIADGLIMDGDVDDRDIREVEPGDLAGYERVHLFAGIGGWDHAFNLAGWPAGRPVWSASPPCPTFSQSGKKTVCPLCASKVLVWDPGRTGYAVCAECGHDWEADGRHLFPEVARLVSECRPAVVFGEQVTSPAGRAWLSGVHAHMEVLGYACGACDLPAPCVKAPHARQRLWWVGSRRERNTAGPPRGLAYSDSSVGGQEREDAERGAGGGLAGQTCERSANGGVPVPVADDDVEGRCVQPEIRVRRTEGGDDADRRGVPGRAADADGGNPEAGEEQRGGEHGQQQEDHGGSGAVGDRHCTGLEGQPRDGAADAGPEREEEGAAGSAATAGVPGWGDTVWLECADPERDGIPTFRRFAAHEDVLEPILFPLVDAGSVRNRLGMVRGAGNAIVAAVAEVFVRAYLEAEEELAGRDNVR